jgi:uncharacterized protein
MGSQSMKTHLKLLALLSLVVFPPAAFTQSPPFHAVAFYSTDVESDHVLFAQDALKFFSSLASKDNFTFDASTDWQNLNESYLSKYQLVLWLNGSPTNPEQRRAFENYMESGGAWLGFHYSGYNDKDTQWPWFVDFLGGAIFYTNSWPPLPANLLVDDPSHAAASSLPDRFLSPANEWYIWTPSPRRNKNVQVLLTLDPSNYPLGLKDILTAGDLPVVWTNRKYKMVYTNMGHGDKIFTSSAQNRLFENILLWLGGNTPPALAESGTASGLRVSFDAIAVNPRTNKTYAVNLTDNTVIVVEPKTGRASTIKVGETPLAISINPQTNRIYIANSGDGTVSVIDGSADKVISAVEVGALPTVIAANPANNNIYIARTFSNSMPVIDGASNTMRTLEPGIQADAIAVNPVTNRLYMLNYESNNVTVLDGSNDSLSKIRTSAHLWGIALNPTTNKIYAGNTGGSRLTIVDGASKTATEANVGQIPCAIAVDSSAGRIYISNYASDNVTVLDAVTMAVIATIGVAAHPQAIAVNPATHVVFAVSARANTISVIDGNTNKLALQIRVDNGPYAIAVDSADNQIFVESIGGDHLTRIDGKTFTATPVIPSPPR